MRVLLTGFEPFGGSAVNPSQMVVEALKPRCERFASGGIELHTLVLPVEARRGPAMLRRAVDKLEPDAVMCLGEDGRTAAITLERVFINLADYRIADNAGRVITDRPIARDGPAAYFSTLPLERVANAVRQAGEPVEFSLTAGAFLCNHVAYAVLHHLAKNRRRVPAGFVHLPRLPEQVNGGRDKPCMPLEAMFRAVDAMLMCLGNGTKRVVTRARTPGR